MQFARINDVTIHYQVLGAPSKPLVVFINALGTDFRIWRDVVVRLAGDFAILCYDMRGHGLSGIGETPCSIETLAADLAALLDHLQLGPALVCGLSIGGLVAQGLWAARPDLVEGLVLCGTAHRIGTPETWDARIAEVEAGGIEAVADTLMARWFTPQFRAGLEAEGYRTMLVRQPVAGYIAASRAVRDADFTETARRIDVPAVVVVGESDGSTPPALCADFARLLPGARFELVKQAGHMAPVEQPLLLSEIVRAFAQLARRSAIADDATRH